MKIYDFPASPNSRKVRAVAYELGLNPEYCSVNLFKGGAKTPSFLALNPNGRAPVMEDGDFVLWESNAIILYLASKNGSPLVPVNARERADVDRWLHWQLAHLGPAIRKVAFERVVKGLTRQGAPDPVLIEQGVAEFKDFTSVFEAMLGQKEYVAGRLSVADFALAAHYSIAEAAGLDLTPYPKARVWFGRMLARESMRRALADAEASIRAVSSASAA